MNERQQIREAVGLLACELQHWVLNCEELDYKFNLTKAQDFAICLDDLAEFALATKKKIQTPLRVLNKQDEITPPR